MFLDLPRVNVLKSKNDVVQYLNNNGYFWEFSNQANCSLPDEYIIKKGLLYLEYEDMDQLFDIFGEKKCREVFERMKVNQSAFDGTAIYLLDTLFFA